MRVSDIMTKDPACCTAQTPLTEAARLMCDHNCGEIPVVGNMEDKMPVAVITDRDIVCRSLGSGQNPMSMTVAECMTQPVITVNSDMSLADCCDVLEKNQIRRVPVVDKKGAVCGIVSQADIALNASQSDTARVVKEISEPAGVHQAAHA